MANECRVLVNPAFRTLLRLVRQESRRSGQAMAIGLLLHRERESATKLARMGLLCRHGNTYTLTEAGLRTLAQLDEQDAQLGAL